MPKKVTYIISDIDKALAFEWVSGRIDKKKFDLSFILLNPGPSIFENFLIQNGVEVYRITCRGKRDWPKVVYKTYRLLKQINPQIVHCHLIQANIIGLFAAKLASVKKKNLY